VCQASREVPLGPTAPMHWSRSLLWQGLENVKMQTREAIALLFKIVQHTYVLWNWAHSLACVLSAVKTLGMRVWYHV